MSTGKGKKRVKNQPVFYEEIKKSHDISLTDSSWFKAKKKALEKGISASEYIERLIRNDSECSSSGEATP